MFFHRWKIKCTLSFPVPIYGLVMCQASQLKVRGRSFSQALHAWILSEIHFLSLMRNLPWFTSGLIKCLPCTAPLCRAFVLEAVALLIRERLGHCPSEAKARSDVKEILRLAQGWADRKWPGQHKHPGILILAQCCVCSSWKCSWSQMSVQPGSQTLISLLGSLQSIETYLHVETKPKDSWPKGKNERHSTCTQFSGSLRELAQVLPNVPFKAAESHFSI